MCLCHISVPLSYLCAPVHLHDRCVGRIALPGGVLMLHCSFFGFRFGIEVQACAEMDTL